MTGNRPGGNRIPGSLLDAAARMDDSVLRIPIGAHSEINCCKPWDGVYLWANHVTERHLPYDAHIPWKCATLNYCMSGRCEVCLPGCNYIYMEPGMLCLDCHEPQDGYGYPTENYEGLEFAFDLDCLCDSPTDALTAYADFGSWIRTLLDAQGGSYLASVTGECQARIETLFRRLTDADCQIGQYRFEALSLLWTLMHGGMTPLSGTAYVTKGQRAIIDDLEKRITADLSRRLTVASLAADYGVSPSALKQYFEKVYGTPISRYLREKRVERAKALLAGSRMSVSEIAGLCGYSHQGKFGEVFRETEGMTPLEYRRLHYQKKGETGK